MTKILFRILHITGGGNQFLVRFIDLVDGLVDLQFHLLAGILQLNDLMRVSARAELRL